MAKRKETNELKAHIFETHEREWETKKFTHKLTKTLERNFN